MNNLKTALPFVWALVILVLCMLPPSDLPKQGWMAMPHFDKLVHFGLYVIFYATIRLAKPNGLVVNILICIGYGIIIEILQQQLTATRSAEITDVLADAVGATFAAGLSLIAKRFRAAQY